MKWVFLVGGLGLLVFFALRKKKESEAGVKNIPSNVDTGSIFFDEVVMNVTKSFEPRGIRNHNPGNLVITTIAWKGKVPVAQNTDKHFEQFTSALFGIRAMFMDVRGDIEKDGLNTVRKLISVYAPASENNTQAYIDFIAKQLGINPDAKITSDKYFPLLKAIIQMENGKQPYTDELIIQAMNTK